MENVPVFVGLDYHRKSVQVCVVDAGGRVLSNRKCGKSIAEIVGQATTLSSRHSWSIGVSARPRLGRCVRSSETSLA
ncbi:MAG: hypothetical protein ACREJD_10265 [Phycisphaerales bacterium]